MQTTSLLSTALPVGLLGAAITLTASSSGVGDPLPAPELEKWKQTSAESFDDLVGRAVLVEFFEYW